MINSEQRVMAMTWRMLGNEADARDASQEVFLRVYKYLGRFRRDQDFFAWLYGITVNVCRDFLKKRQNHTSRFVSFGEDAGVAYEVADEHADAEQVLVQTQQHELIGKAMGTLPFKERASIVLRDVEGLSTDEVARIMKSSATTVRSQISSARKKIRIYCQQHQTGIRRGEGAMNCKQLDELLPLYAGRDLDEKRARLVSEHIQICSACARVAGEYRDAVELAQHFAPPVFSDNVYASVRRQVMQQIEDEPTAPLLAQMFGSWFRPRMAWAAASAVIIAFGFFALYLVVNRTADVQPVAEIHPTVNPEQTPESMATPRQLSQRAPGHAKPAEDKRKRHVEPCQSNAQTRADTHCGRRVFRESCAILRRRTVCRLSMQSQADHLCGLRFKQRIRTFASSGFLNRTQNRRYQTRKESRFS